MSIYYELENDKINSKWYRNFANWIVAPLSVIGIYMKQSIGYQFY